MNSEQFQDFLADDFNYHRLTPDQYMHVLQLKRRCLEIFAAIKSNERATEDIRSRSFQYYPEPFKIIPEFPLEIFTNLSSTQAGQLDSLYAKIVLLSIYHASTSNLYNIEISRETQLYRAIRDMKLDPIREQNSILEKQAQAVLAEAESRLAERQLELTNKQLRKAEVQNQLVEGRNEELKLLKEKRIQRQRLKVAKRAEKRCKKVIGWNKTRF